MSPISVRRLAPLLLLLLVSGGRMSAAEPTVIIDSLRSLAPATEERKFTVPAFGIEHQVRLGLEVRIDWPSLAGSNPWIRVAVNGNFLTRPDLLNKRDDFKLRGGVDLTWSKGDRWRVLYSPDFEAALTQKEDANSCADADPYRFVWDISRYVRPGENTLTLQNLQVLAKPTTMVLRNVQVEVGRPISAPAGEDATPAPTGPVPTYVARGAQRVPMEVTLSPAGRLGLKVAGKALAVTTRASLPGGGWQEADAAQGRAVAPGKKATASWQAGAIAVRRTVEVRGDHVHVADTFTNPGKELAGLMVEHRLALAEKPRAVRLAGRETFSDTAQVYNAYHPSAYAQWPEVGVGLVAEDDIFRVHARAFREADAAGLSDHMLGIAPGGSATLEWEVYPVPAGDYWDFVNAVRRTWGANFAIPGPFCYAMHFRDEKPAEWYGEWARKRSLRITCGGIAKYPDGKYAHGTGIMFAPKWVAFEADWTRKMLATAPEVKVLAYFHAQCSTEPDGETKYADSRLINEKGEHLGYPYSYRLPLYIATRDNSYGKALWGYVRTCLEQMGVSGLYWDEMSHSVLEFAHQAPWDGCTVQIDRQTHAVTGKMSSVILLMQPLQQDIARYLRERGKFLMANTQPATRTMLREKIVRFVETGSYSAVANTHLGCPIGLANHHQEATHADAAIQVRRILDYGGIYYGHIYIRDPAPWNYTGVMFPITPVELREGVVLGEERIHTARSGRFGWPDGAAAEVFVVDAQGARVPNPQVKEVTEGGRRLYEIRMPGDCFAVLVKK